MEVFAANLEATYPDSEENCAYTLIPANDDRSLVNHTDGRGINGLMIVLMSVVGLVLLIACSNVASILLARASARQKEIAIRLAMGAGQGRVIRQLLTESMVLAILAGGTGILLAYWTISLIHGIDMPFFDTFPIDFSLDRNVLLFTLGVTVVTGFIFGLVPAVQILRTNVVVTLKDQGSSISQTAGKSRMQGLLVMSQLAMSLFLLVMAGMFVRSLQNAEHLDVGFDPSHNAVLSINLGLGQYEEESGSRFYHDLLRQVREMPAWDFPFECLNGTFFVGPVRPQLATAKRLVGLVAFAIGADIIGARVPDDAAVFSFACVDAHDATLLKMMVVVCAWHGVITFSKLRSPFS